jgi:hypothetical protein
MQEKTMRPTSYTLITAIAVMITSPAFASDEKSCMKCHDADEFSGMPTTDIVAAVKDPSIQPHKKLSNISDEQLQAIAAALSAK